VGALGSSLIAASFAACATWLVLGAGGEKDASLLPKPALIALALLLYAVALFTWFAVGMHGGR
jgi:hypothetical protein